MNNNSVEYRTPDLPLAGFLLTRGHKLIRVDSTNGRGFFVFLEEAVMHDRINYLNGEGVVEPGQYMFSIRKLKSSLAEK